MSDHFHVVSYLDWGDSRGQDYCSGPLDLESARVDLAEYVDDACDFPNAWITSGVDRFVEADGYYVAEIIPCAENCFSESEG